jgi:hypothetical protein
MHAALVTAYKDFDMLERLVLRLQSFDMRVFVHIDKRSPGVAQALERSRALGAEAHSWYSIHWGSRSHLGALLRLMRAALADPRVSYVHTLSGQDYPIKTAAVIESRCDGQIFMESEPLESLPNKVRIRFERYHLRDLVDPLFRLPNRSNEIALRLQTLLRITRRRTRSHSLIRKGLVWVSMPAEAARYCCESDQAARLWSELRYTALPEEFYFQTLLAASPFADRIDTNNKRFMEWTPRNGSRPAVLDSRDCDALRHTDALFARKLDSQASAKLLNAIDQHLDAQALREETTAKGIQHQPTIQQAVSL